MGMFEALAKVLASAFSIWEHKEKMKYVEELIALKKAYYDEINKPIGARNDAQLDSIRFRVCVLADSFAANATVPHS